MKKQILLFGAGKFGKNHLRVLKELENKRKITLKGVVVASEESKKRIEKEYDTECHVGLKRSLLETVDAIDIVTPASTHYELVKNCLNYADVFVEKPLALSSKCIEEIIQKSESYNKKLMVGHIFVFNNAVNFLKDTISEKSKELRSIRGEFIGRGEPPKDCGALHEFLHLFYIANYLIDKKPDRIYCKILQNSRSGFEKYTTVQLNYENIPVKLDLGWIGDEQKRCLSLQFSDQQIYCDLVKQTIHVKKNSTVQTINCYTEEPLKIELERFIDIINDENKFYPDGKAALEIQHIIDAAKLSSEQNKHIYL